ncbi:hypothetical protein MCOR03_002149 [Pyricularia oryzae]|nr:hypothetical protein MCOR03_002149 [Pyricularia oryzae]
MNAAMNPKILAPPKISLARKTRTFPADVGQHFVEHPRKGEFSLADYRKPDFAHTRGPPRARTRKSGHDPDVKPIRRARRSLLSGANPTNHSNRPKSFPRRCGEGGSMEEPIAEGVDIMALLGLPKTRPVSDEQLATEARDIYAVPVVSENKSIDVQSVQKWLKCDRDPSQPNRSKVRTARKPRCFNLLVAVIQLLGRAFATFPKLEIRQAAASDHRRLLAALSPVERLIASKNTPEVPIWSHEASQLVFKIRQLHSESMAAPNSGLADPEVCSVRGLANGHAIAAVADTGADGCFVSAAFAKELGATIITTKSVSIKLASGKMMKSTGSMPLEWIFQGDSQVHNIVCHVVETLAHPLSLGRPFLEATRSLTTHKSRIIRAVHRAGRNFFRLHLLGEGLGEIAGHLDGKPTLALPDTGSEIMAVSTALAKRRGWTIDRRSSRRVQVQFADGSTAFTRGLVSGLEWDFGNGDRPTKCDFHVIDDLPVEVILSSDFIFDLDLFSSRYETLFVQPKHWRKDDDDVLFCNIRLQQSLRQMLYRVFGRKSSSPLTVPGSDCKRYTFQGCSSNYFVPQT